MPWLAGISRQNESGTARLQTTQPCSKYASSFWSYSSHFPPSFVLACLRLICRRCSIERRARHYSLKILGKNVFFEFGIKMPWAFISFPSVIEQDMETENLRRVKSSLYSNISLGLIVLYSSGVHKPERSNFQPQLDNLLNSLFICLFKKVCIFSKCHLLSKRLMWLRQKEVSPIIHSLMEQSPSRNSASLFLSLPWQFKCVFYE